MGKMLALLLPCVLFVCASCGMPGVTLTDELVVKWCNAYKVLRSSSMADSSGKVNTSSGEYERIIKEAGFKDYAQFMMVNVKIGQAMSLVESDVYMKKMDEMASENYGPWADMLTNPDIPEKDKAAAREQIKKAKADLEQKKKAAGAMLGLLNGATDKQSVEVLRRHYKEVKEAMTGFSAEQLESGGGQ